MKYKIFILMAFLGLFPMTPAFCMSENQKEDFFSKLHPKMQMNVIGTLPDNKDVLSMGCVTKSFYLLIKTHPRIKISLKLNLYDNRRCVRKKPTGIADISYYCGDKENNKKIIFLGQLYAETPHGIFEKKQVREYILTFPYISGNSDWISTDFWLIRRMETGKSIYWSTERNVNICNHKELILTVVEKRGSDFETFSQWLDYPR